MYLNGRKEERMNSVMRPGPVHGGTRAVSLVLMSLLLGSCSSPAPLWSGDGTTMVGPASNAYTRIMAPIVAEKAGETGTNENFRGAVVADEPQAALAARQIIERGGTAGDAAAALYFVLSVTYPAAAGLGGGGICLAHAPRQTDVESISFLPREAAAGGAVAVPGNVRGMAYVQAKYGSMAWPAVVSPAQLLAGTGFTVSDASAARFTHSADVLNRNPSLARLFSNGQGGVVPSGSVLTQPDLAGTLSAIRQRNVNGFYAGPVARAFVEGANEAGGRVTLDDLGRYRNDLAPAQQAFRSGYDVSLPASSTRAGVFTAKLLKKLEASKTTDAQALAAVARQVAGEMGAPGNFDADMGATSFAVVDSKGGAVACAVTMNGAFGLGVPAGTTGVVLAASASASKTAELAPSFLAPILVVGDKMTRVYFAGAAAGAPRAAAALGNGIHLLANSSMSAGQALAQGPLDATSTANLIYCKGGIPGNGACSLGVNPAGSGIGLIATSVKN